MKSFNVHLHLTTTGEHDVESIEAWLTDLLAAAMRSAVEENKLKVLHVSEKDDIDLQLQNFKKKSITLSRDGFVILLPMSVANFELLKKTFPDMAEEG